MLLTAAISLVEHELLLDLTLLYSEIGVMCSIILLYLLLKLRATVIVIPNKSYIHAMITCLYVMLITDNIWKWVSAGYLHPSIRLSYFINGLYFIALDVFLFFVIFYFKDSRARHTYEDSKVNISRMRFELKMIIGSIFAIHVVVNFTNPITKWFFYIGEDLSYNYGKYYVFEYILPYGVLLLYTINLLVESYVKYKRNIKQSIYDKPSHIILYQLVPSIMGLIGFKIPYLPFFTTGMTLFLVVFYIRMVEYFVRIDPVTQMHTRRSILKIFNERVKDHNIEFKPLTICMFSIVNYYDLNELDGVPVFDNIIVKIADTFSSVNQKYRQYSPEVSRLDSVNFLIVISTDERAILDAYKKDLFNSFKDLKKAIGEIELKITYAYIRYNDSMKASELLADLETKIKEYAKINRNSYII